MTILEVNNISYGYTDGEKYRCILDEVACEFETGKFYTILGESGVGKTTFLSLIAALDVPQKGDICFEGKPISKIGYERYRRNDIGMVFQNYNLIPYMNAVENVLVAMGITDNPLEKERKQKAYAILAELGIDKAKADRRVNKLSGGEQQRVAIARAISTNVNVILADEATGNLDKDTSQVIIEIFQRLAHEKGKCVIVVTHDTEIAQASDVIWKLSPVTHRFEFVEKNSHELS